MTCGEFRAWANVTAISVSQWLRDEVTFHNRGEMLFYRGGERGIYIWIYRDGTLSCGTYEDAVPHIGEATFKQTYSKIFQSQAEAFARVQATLGPAFNVQTLPTF